MRLHLCALLRLYRLTLLGLSLGLSARLSLRLLGTLLGLALLSLCLRLASLLSL